MKLKSSFDKQLLTVNDVVVTKVMLLKCIEMFITTTHIHLPYKVMVGSVAMLIANSCMIQLFTFP